MPQPAPVVLVLHGDNEFAIAQWVAEQEAKLGDPAMASMNITRLDGRTFNLDELLSVASAMPFLAERRLVILSYPLARLTSPAAQKKFLEQLTKVPPTTSLLLVETRFLTDDRERKKGKLHWLEKWAQESTGLAQVQVFAQPRGEAMASWIQDQARKCGGQFSKDAARTLMSLTGSDTRLAENEIHKLLAYVNYARPVESDDVNILTADNAQVDIFEMVDALGNRDGRRAMDLLHRLLEEKDPLGIFSMIVRQFRLLLLAREMMDNGWRLDEMARELKLPRYPTEKVANQARHFTLPVLETVYRRLAALEEGIKTGQVHDTLALDTLVAGFTNPSG